MGKLPCNLLMAQMSMDIGGAETHIMELSLALQQRGYRVIIASNGGAFVPELEAAGIVHYQVPLHNKKPSNMLKSYRMLRKIIKNEKIDLVHAHARIPGFIAGKVCRKDKIPFVTTAHWVFETGKGLKYLTNWGQETIAVSEDIKSYLIKEYQLPEEQIVVTINGINTDRFSKNISFGSVAVEFGFDKDAFRIVHISRLDRSRADVAFLLVEAFAEIKKEIPNAELVIVGGGDVYHEIIAKAEAVNKTLGDQFIKLTGPRTDINRFVASADLFVGVSRAALEAMAAEKPTVLAGNEGDLGLYRSEKEESAFGSNFTCRGEMMPTVESVKNSILEYYNLKKTEQEQICRFCKKTVDRHYSVRRMADDAEKAYRAVLDK
ncbi:MAG: glycosyltransferase family 4 protein [Ruminococcaceae bacterium]|nr:glycosyltransferase family 4 protein [Oscillospiraceae bacterium]